MAESARKNTPWSVTEVETLLCVALSVYVSSGHVCVAVSRMRAMACEVVAKLSWYCPRKRGTSVSVIAYPGDCSKRCSSIQKIAVERMTEYL